MPIALWCVLVAALLPIVCVGIAKVSGPRYDHHNPRAWLAQQTGVAGRAGAAQQNHFEAFPFFAVAVLVAILGAIAFVVARVLYTVCYLADWAVLRSLMWVTGVGLCVALFVQPAFAH